MKSNAQEVLNRLCRELLGKDWYIVDPVCENQANEIIAEAILEKYKKGYSKKKRQRVEKRKI